MTPKARLEAAIGRALAAAGATESPAIVGVSTRPEFGDYQANGVMPAAKRLQRKPRELAAEVATLLAADPAFTAIAEAPEVAGPGFINIRLRQTYLASALASQIPLISQQPQSDTVVVDYSAPNLAKEMHVGHLRSTIIGDAMARVLEALGHQVIRQNHVGDWGTQFGMLVAHLDEAGTNSLELADLEVFYQASKARFDADPAFADRARSVVVDLQSGDATTVEKWRRFIDISLGHCDAIYQRLGVSLSDADVQAESAYNDDLAQVIIDLDTAGLLTVSDGAKCVFLDAFKGKDDAPLPLIVQKSDGGYLYATTDLAAIRYRHNGLHADRVLYFVDARQKLHFDQVFAVARRAGFAPPSVELSHHPFGAMLGTDGRPFRTRAGGVIKLMELLDEAEQRAAALVTEKNPDLEADDQANIARVVGIGAVKYADLSKNRTSDYVFDWDQMLSFEGNTAPYLQYAYARIRSLFRRGEVDPAMLTGAPAIDEPAEHQLAVLLTRFEEVLLQVASDAYPHHLCAYLMDLAGAYMRFYETCPVLNAPEPTRTGRLVLCERTAATLKEGLGLLGIGVLERM
jgi:arginyl-tRNA synthetase